MSLIPAVEVVDWLPYRTLDANTTHMYGISRDAYHVVRIDTAGTATEMSFDFEVASPTGGQTGANYKIRDVWAAPTLTTPHQIFALVVDMNTTTTINQKYYLFRSVDGGANFGANATADDGDFVLAIGWDDNQSVGQEHIRGVSILKRGFCHAVVNNNDIFLVGEYNVAGAITPAETRIVGGKGDRVRLMQSSDGITWVETATWNVGTRHVRHIHGVTQDGDNGPIYIYGGDSDSESGIVRITDLGSVADNTVFSDYNLTVVKGVGGNQSYRTVDMIFDNTYAYFYADTPQSNVNAGIHRIKKDFSDDPPIRVDASVKQETDALGWFMLRDSGRFIALEAATGTSFFYRVLTSSDGVLWDQAAVVNGEALGQTQASSLFAFDNKLYMATPDGAGKYNTDTIVFNWDGYLIPGDQGGVDPVILHPVHWVGDFGAGLPIDSNPDYGNGDYRGGRPSLPWATLKYSLTSNRLTKGARVIVADEHTEPDGFIINYTGSAIRDGVGPITVSGFGQNNYSINFTPTLPYCLYWNSSFTPLVFQRINITTTEGVSYILNPVSSLQIGFNRCNINPGNTAMNRVVDFSDNGNVSLSYCTVRGGAVYQFDCDKAGLKLYIKYCKLSDAGKIIQLNNNPDITIYKTIFYNYTYGIYGDTSQTVLPTMTGVIFAGGGANIYPMSFAVTGAANIDYCAFDKLPNDNNLSLSDKSIVIPDLVVSSDGQILSGYEQLVDACPWIPGVNDGGQPGLDCKLIYNRSNIGPYEGLGAPSGGGQQYLGGNRGGGFWAR